MMRTSHCPLIEKGVIFSPNFRFSSSSFTRYRSQFSLTTQKIITHSDQLTITNLDKSFAVLRNFQDDHLTQLKTQV
ncbi:hypothetical protein Nepgr_010293 [Nepenthes gracilis]|uniref:Uncharacterized protein n=1 Tax=Nepenthes gracilis TaxID=150966 RepID=A0AAD3SC88_NEPGR|nr:hypothetical protein Nepgr_010293 [Nepenthes gracilis]